MTSLDQLKLIVNRYLILADPNIVKFLAGVAIANKIQTLTPTWVFLVGASSGGKSTLLEPFNAVPDTRFISDMTAKTLFSGMKGATDNAMIYKLPQKGGMVIIPDFTLMLNKDEQTAGEIMSQFRLIFDGKYDKLSGNGTNAAWQGKFGFLAGVTDAVFTQQQKYQALGERMMYYTFNQPDPMAALDMAYENIDKTKQATEEIGKAFADYLSTITIPEEMVKLESYIVENLKPLSVMVTSARSSVTRDKYQRNRMVQNNFNEMPMRLFKQLLNLSQGLIALNGDGKLHDDDQVILYKTAMDSIPLPRLEVMRELTSYEKGDIAGVAAALSGEYETIKMTMQDLAAKGILTQHKHGNTSFYYKMKPQYRELMSRFQNITMTDNTLEKVDESLPIETPPMPQEVPLNVEEQAALALFNN